MFIMFRAALVAALAVAFLIPEVAVAGRLKSVEVTERAQLPKIRPSWPIPAEPNQLFYLQRSSNSNTVVYTAVYDEQGNLRARKPAQAYWRRYNTTGERKALKPIEQRFAYGLNMRKADAPGAYWMTLKPLPELPMLLRQTGPGRAELIATLGGRKVRAAYAFVTIDESGLIPNVTHLSLHGIDVATGKAVSEVFAVSGGAINQ